jgi:hypothetical protein
VESSANPPGPRSGALGSARTTGLYIGGGRPDASEVNPEDGLLDRLVMEDVGVAVTLTTMDMGGSSLKREVLKQPCSPGWLIKAERR